MALRNGVMILKYFNLLELFKLKPEKWIHHLDLVIYLHILNMLMSISTILSPMMMAAA